MITSHPSHPESQTPNRNIEAFSCSGARVWLLPAEAPLQIKTLKPCDEGLVDS